MNAGPTDPQPNGHAPTRSSPPMRDHTKDPRRHAYYGGKRKDGSPCGGRIIAGTKICRMHAGVPGPKAKAAGAVVVELAKWGLDGHTTLRDAGEVLLRLVTQSAARVELYAQLLGEAYAAAERLRQAHEVDGLDLVSPVDYQPELDDGDGPVAEPLAVATARQDLRRIFTTGGVGALIGFKYDVDRYGRVYAVEEAIRGLAKLEADERDRCANFAAKAVAAGLAERQVRLAERQGELLIRFISGVLDDLGLSDEQTALVASVVPRHLRALSGPGVIEGTVK